MKGRLPTAALGRSGMDITRVGFGAWAIGGAGWSFGWGEQDDLDSVRAIVHAVEQGINWVDTAAVYGHGHSEEVTGKALRALPENDRPYVFTKTGLRWDESDPMARAARLGDPAFIIGSVEDALRRIGIERIDLFQMHWPPNDHTATETYWAAFSTLVEQGKVRAIGLSNHDVPALELAEAVAHVDSLQPPFSMLKRDAAADVIPWCHAHDTGVIVYSPMASGVLSGAWSREKAEALGVDDWRSRSEDHSGALLDRNLALVDRLRPIAAAHDVTVGAIAIAWTLAFPGVTGAIVGGRSPEQVDGWVGAGSITLTAGELAEISAALTELDAGSGPLQPVG